MAEEMRGALRQVKRTSSSSSSSPSSGHNFQMQEFVVFFFLSLCEICEHQLEHNVSFLISSRRERSSPTVIFKQTPGNDTCEVLANHSEGDAFMLTLQQTSEQLVKPARLVHQGP